MCIRDSGRGAYQIEKEGIAHVIPFHPYIIDQIQCYIQEDKQQFECYIVGIINVFSAIGNILVIWVASDEYAVLVCKSVYIV